MFRERDETIETIETRLELSTETKLISTSNGKKYRYNKGPHRTRRRSGTFRMVAYDNLIWYRKSRPGDRE